MKLDRARRDAERARDLLARSALHQLREDHAFAFGETLARSFRQGPAVLVEHIQFVPRLPVLRDFQKIPVAVAKPR